MGLAALEIVVVCLALIFLVVILVRADRREQQRQLDLFDKKQRKRS